MNNNKADMILRLIARDEGVRDALQNMGKDGKKALREIDRAAKGARPGLKAVDNVVNDIKNSADGMVSRLGPAGSLLKGLGPIGIAAGAGLTAVVLAAHQLGAAGERAIMTLAEMSRTAERLELDPEQLQALRLELERLGISSDKTDAAFATAQKTLSEATLGTGEFYSAVKLINPELVEQVRLATTTSERLELIKTAYNEAGSEAERNTILVRTFGDGNVEAGLRILQMKGTLDEATGAYKNQGLVISKELLPRYEEMAQQLTANKQIADRLGLQLETRFADLGLHLSQFKAGAAGVLLDLLPSTGVDDDISQLTRKIARLRENIDDPSAFEIDLGLVPGYQEDLEAAEAQLDALKKKRDQLAQTDAIIGAQFLTPSATPVDPSDPGKADPSDPGKSAAEIAKAQAAAAKAQADLTAARSRAIRVLADLGDVTGLVAEKQKGLDELVQRELITAAQRDEALRRYEEHLHSQTAAVRALKEAEKRAAEIRLDLASKEEAVDIKVAAREKELTDLKDRGLLTNQQVAKSLRQYREELDGTEAAQKTLEAALIDTLDPMQRLARDLTELHELQALATIDDQEFARIIEAQTKEATDASERETFGETLDNAEARIRDAAMGAEAVIAAKVEAERQILEALGERLTDVDASAYLEKYEQGLRDAADAGGEFAGINDLIGDGIRGNIRSMEDFGQAALGILADIITKALESSDALGGIFGNGDFGAAIGDVLASVFHEGTPNVAQPKRTRRINASSRLAQDEHITILRDQERVFSRSDNRALIRAINSAGRTTVVMNPVMPPAWTIPTMDFDPAIYNHHYRAASQPAPGGAQAQPAMPNITIVTPPGEPVERKESTNAKGERELLILVGKQARRQAAQYLASPAGQKQMKAQYGLRPTTLGKKG